MILLCDKYLGNQSLVTKILLPTITTAIKPCLNYIELAKMNPPPFCPIKATSSSQTFLHTPIDYMLSWIRFPGLQTQT